MIIIIKERNENKVFCNLSGKKLIAISAQSPFLPNLSFTGMGRLSH